MKFPSVPVHYRVSLFYMIFGSFWILLSDRLLAIFISDISKMTTLQTYKGWAFVIASTALIFTLLRRELTRRYIIEIESRENEEQYRSLFEDALDMIHIVDASGAIIEANPADLNALGYTYSELIGKPLLEIVHPDYYHITQEHLEKVRKGLSIDRYETALLTKTGEKLVVEASAVPNMVNEQFVSARVIMRDVTQRKQAEYALERNEQVLSLFVKYSPAAIAMFDKHMNYIATSDRYLEDYSLGNQTLTGRSHYDVFPEIPERWKEIHQRCLAGAVEKCDEDPFPRADCRLDWVRWEIHPWQETTGEIGGIILFSEVITERKQTEDELRQSRDRLTELSRQLVRVHETEQRSIGRELHDQIGQMLTALKITLEISQQIPAEKASEKLKSAQGIVDDLLTRVSRLSLELRPPMLDDLGLIPALLWHVNQYQEQTSLIVDFKHSGAEGNRFGSETETTAYRIIQESLTNIARHANATHVRLEINVLDDQMKIQIEDNGQGFDTETAMLKNRGLSGMRERALWVGGTFQIDSKISQGTRKRIQLPLLEGKR